MFLFNQKAASKNSIMIQHIYDMYESFQNLINLYLNSQFAFN